MIPRKIVCVAGELGQFAVADDGTVWHWAASSGKWALWGRPELPPNEETVDAFAIRGAGRLPGEPPPIVTGGEPDFGYKAGDDPPTRSQRLGNRRRP